jgi:ADP-ribosyl-[dinitrogen reductase] hydrolase
LGIAEVGVSGSDGIIGVTFAPGKKQVSAFSGKHDRDLAADLDVIAGWNAAAVVTLVEDHEIKALKIKDIGHEVRRRFMEWHHWPIADVSVPAAFFDLMWYGRSTSLRRLLGGGSRILIHCKGGLGRAGMVAARLLADFGETPDAAIAKVRAARPGAIETPEQKAWVAQSRPRLGDGIEPARWAARDRAMGALVGLAVGDAVGTTLEFTPKPDEPVITTMIGRGPFDLRPGEWTDDTAMALALADSLLANADLDPSDLMGRFVDWWRNGAYSCTGDCFDIGIQTSSALRRFEASGKALAGDTRPEASGNGALMRLAPIAVRHWRDRDRLAATAELQTRTTHGSPETLEASDIFATLLADAIAGQPLDAIMNSDAARRIKGEWRGANRDAIRGTGYVVDALRAAVWAVSRTTTFRSAILLAANLGEDADTTAAITGQLAGALYGWEGLGGGGGIPGEWLNCLAWGDRIEDTAARLFDESWPAEDDEPVGPRRMEFSFDDDPESDD